MCQKSHESTDYLKGLTAVKGDATVNDNTTYLLSDGKKISIDKAFKLLESKEYTLKVYANTKGDQTAVLKKLSIEEIEKQKRLHNEYIENKEYLKKIKTTKYPAKPFTLVDLNNNTYDLQKLKGKIVVINFWFTKCKPCVAEIPELNNLVDKYSGKDVVFLGITFDNKKTLEKFLAKKEFKYNIIPDAMKIINENEIKSFPANIIIDKDSNVIFTGDGLNSETTIPGLDYIIEKLLNS